MSPFGRMVRKSKDGSPFPKMDNPDNPEEQINYSAEGEWDFPEGTVFIKHFEMPIDESNPNIRKRLETRFTVRAKNGKVYGLTYKWREDGSDADLLGDSLDEPITISTPSGPRTQIWHYPSRNECLTCHVDAVNGTLGLRTRYLNNDFTYPSTGTTANQLVTLSHLGFIPESITDGQTANLPSNASQNDPSASLEKRARSYLDLNCAYCHRPGTGNRAVFDARIQTPLFLSNLFSDNLNQSLNIPGERIIAAGDISKSVLYQRIHSVDPSIMMPPLAKGEIDQEGAALVAEWIQSLDPDNLFTCEPTNVALNKPATQSSTFGGTLDFEPGNGVDGDRTGTNVSGSITHTLADPNSWWEVDLEDVYSINLVKIWNRTDCCSERLNNFYVIASDVPFISQDLTQTLAQPGVEVYHFAGEAGRETNIDLVADARYLRIQLGNPGYLQLAEVEVMGCLQSAENPCTASGEILMERWNNIGTSFEVSAIPVNTPPTATTTLNSFEIPVDVFDQYGVRVRGFICAPQSGNYTFWISSDDKGELWLSTDDNPANKQRIAHVPGWTSTRLWDKYPEQQSAQVYLRAGESYYVEALMKENGGGDNLAVGWQLPNGNLERPMGGNVLSPWMEPDLEAPSIPQNLLASNIGQNGLTLNWSASTDNRAVAGYYLYQNGDDTPIASVSGTSFDVSGLLPGSTHQFAVAAFDEAGNTSAQSQAIQVTTLFDNPPPCETINFSNTVVSGFGGGQDQGTFEVQENGTALKITNNAWKATPYAYTLTSNTILEFEFKSDIQGEYHGIGMAMGSQWVPERAFSLYGTQDVAGDIADFDNYSGSDYVSYTIPIGQYYTGAVNQIFYLADHDASPFNGTSYFRNVRIYEAGACEEGCNGENIALGRNASQSSTYGFGEANLAVDGILSGSSPWSADLQHTKREAQPWWEVDLGTNSQIDTVRIFNREDCCQERLTDYYVFVSDAPIQGSMTEILANNNVSQYFQAGASGAFKAIPIDTEGQYVRIQLSGNSLLHMSEVEVIGCNLGQVCETPTVSINPAGPFEEGSSPVQLSAEPAGGTWSGAVGSDGVFNPSLGVGTYEVTYTYEAFAGCSGSDVLEVVVLPSGSACTSPTNLALNQTASQSSTYGIGEAALAFDGNTTGTSAWSADLQHTTNEFQPWLQVDLGQQSKLNEAVIHNRSDATFNRLKDFYILVSDVPMSSASSLDELLQMSSVDQVFFSGPAGTLETVALGGITGRYIRIQLSAKGIIHLAEVELMGCIETGGCVDPVVSIAPAGPFADDAGIQQLVGTPSGGTWSGAASSAGTFDPSQGTGTYEVIYTYTDQNGCSASATQNIEVFPGGSTCNSLTNLALNQAATMSSTYGIGEASLAVDGNTTGTSPWTADLTHSQNEDQPWWQVDLGANSQVEQIKIYNRTDCCFGRLRDFYLLSSSSPISSSATLAELLSDPTISQTFISGSATLENTYSLQVEARYVRIQLSNPGILQLAEVELWGCSSVGSGNRFASITEGPEQGNQPELTVYPNPANQVAHIQVSQVLMLK